MIIDWQLIGLLSAWSVNLIALAGVYHGLKADIASLRADIALALLTERTERQAADTSTHADLVGLIATAERRRPSHAPPDELVSKINELVLKVDRLERPKGEQ
jgi:hypothetical protein